MEKKSEFELQTYFKDIPEKYILYSPKQDDTLKMVFKSCSKTGDKYGIPDRILFNETCLIVFECKHGDIQTAVSDVFIYKNKMDYTHITHIKCIYFVAFVSPSNYEIFDMDSNKINQTLENIIKTNFIINTTIQYNKIDMDNTISKIHNYIRDNTKISNEDKPFFIALILISVNRDSFKHMIDNYDSKKYVYDILIENIRDYEIDASVFSFMRNDNNNIHLLNLIRLIQEVSERCKNTDLLNLFYTEFVKYENTDSKSLGIVLTPDHIVKLMVDILNINNNDIILDLCSGTGSFLWSCLRYSPRKIIGCEYQNKLFNLLKCNDILRNQSKCKVKLHKNDCFNIKFEATKSIINPPYGMKNNKELTFLKKQLESICDGGLAVSIIPISKLNTRSVLRDFIYTNAQIKLIIICNNKLFNPTAHVHCAIILLQKDCCGNTGLTKILDFTDDGFTMKRTYGRCNYDNAEKTKQLFNRINTTNGIKLDIEIDWIKQTLTNTTIADTIKLLALRNLELEYKTKLKIIEDMTYDENAVEYKEYYIKDIFDIMKKPKLTEKYTQLGGDMVNLITAKNCNNGVKGTVPANENTFTGNKIVLVVGGDGGCGLAFYQQNAFNIESATIVLSPKNEIINMNLESGQWIAAELSKYKQKYSRTVGWTIQRIKNDTLRVPIKYLINT